METKSTYRGYLTRTRFVNENGWGIGTFSLEIDSKKQVSVKGSIKGMDKKTLYEITGIFEDHPKYGKNFKIESYCKAQINSNQQQILFLSGPSFPGVGSKTAELIVNSFKENAIKEISEDLNLLDKIKGLNKQLIPIIKKGINDNILSDGAERLRYIFFENNLKTSILDWMENKYEKDNEKIQAIFENRFLPYSYDKEIAVFEELDKVALYFGLDLDSSERIAYWAWKIANTILFETGDTYTNKSVLAKKIMKTLNINDLDKIMNGFMFAKAEKVLIFTENKIYTKESYDEEQIIASNLIKFKTHDVNKKELKFIEQEIKNIEQEIAKEDKLVNFEFDEIQKKALIKFCNNKLLLITGGPGTGKTTLIKAFVKLFNRLENDNNFAIATPTGRAASRIRETFSNSNAITIHKLLQAKDTKTFNINAQNPLNEHLLIIDECSMIDNRLFAQFIQSCDRVKKIVLVGDTNQLPSVGYGNLFADIVESNLLKKIELNKIHRQKENSEIIDLAYKVLSKEAELVDIVDKKNIFASLDFDQEIVLKNIINLMKNYWKEIKIKQNNLQIICPMYSGLLGIDEINAEIQTTFNENINDKKKVFNRGDYRFAVGDKIMFLRNEVDYDLSNGDVGKLLKFNFNSFGKLKDIVCEFNEREIVIKPSDFIDIKLAYATSVHKTQGSEYENVVLILDDNNHNQLFLNNSLIYTAITRAKNNLFIFGRTSTLFNAIIKDNSKRNTTLKETLKRKWEKNDCK